MGKSLEYDYVNGKSIHGNVLKITNHNRNANLKYNEITSHIYQLYLKQQKKNMGWGQNSVSRVLASHAEFLGSISNTT